jgi:methyl-accepting chemotaxis protein
MNLNVALIAATFERAKKENGGATALGLRFYQRLFEKYPSVRPLFKTPPEAQHKKLMASVAAIVATVTQPDKMMPYLHAMGIRHNAYGTENAHYPAVQENLIAVLGEHLSQEGEWTEEMQQNWEAALAVISAVMMTAANHPDEYSQEIINAVYMPDGFKSNNPKPWELAEA